MPFRVTIRHVQTVGSKTGGWGESWWSQAASQADAITNTQILRDALFLVKGNQTLLPSARIAVPPPAFRQTKLVEYPVPGTTGAASYDSDYPTSALLLKVTSPGPYETLQWMRGIPDGVVSAGGIYTPATTANFTKRMNAFLAVLTNSSYGWSQRKLDLAVPKKIVTALNVATGVITAPGHGYGAAGAIVTVRVSGFIVPRGVNKVWQATIVDANTMQLLSYIPPTQVGLVAAFNAAYVRLQTKIYVQIQTAEIVRATEHYTGRPTEVLGGRRRNRRRSRAGTPVDA